MRSLNHRIAYLALALLLALTGAVGILPGQTHAAVIINATTDLQQDAPDAEPSVPAGPWRDAKLYQSPYANIDGWSAVESPAVAGLISDNFNACSIDEGVWTLVDPPGEATFAADGENLVITVPSGVNYDLFPNSDNAARALQPITADEDFQVVVKFVDMKVTPIIQGQFRMQGIVIPGLSDPTAPPSAAETMRFEFYTTRNASDIVETHAIGAVFRPAGDFFIALDDIIPVSNGDDLYMRVTRETITAPGGLETQRWTMEYSDTGTDGDWTTVGPADGLPNDPFILRHISQQVGVYAGSTTTDTPGTEPGNTAMIDFFWADDDPITTIPDDDTLGYNVVKDTVGNGSIAITPIDPGPYACGDDVTLSATPDNGWNFSLWSGDVNGVQNPITVPFEMGLMATANFSQAEQNVLDVTVNGNGTVTSDPAGIDCGAACSANFTEDSVVTLTATADPGFVFSGWGGAASGTNSVTNVTMDAAKSVVANFVEQGAGNALTVQVFPVDGSGGSVTSDPAGIDCGNDCSETYVPGTDVELTAAPNPGYAFIGWSGAASGDSPVTNVTMSANQTVIATFDQKAYTLSVSGVGGTVTVDPVKTTYTYGDEVTLTATATGADPFSGWTGDLTSTENPVTFTVGVDTSESDTEISIVAQFGDAPTGGVYLPIVRNNAP